jgi:hypothetical protein
VPDTREAMILNERESHINPEMYEVDDKCDPTGDGIEVTYSGGNSAHEDDLMWV